MECFGILCWAPSGALSSPQKKWDKSRGVGKRSSQKDECIKWSLHRLHCLACCAYAFASDAVHYSPMRSLLMLLLLCLTGKKKGDSTFDDSRLHSRGCSMCASSQSRGSSVHLSYAATQPSNAFDFGVVPFAFLASTPAGRITMFYFCT